MKAVLLSIKPEYCELIASGKKTVEIRRNRPKIDTPFKCYIYCTKGGRPLVWGSPVPNYVEENLVTTSGYSREEAERIFGCWNGKVIGEFVCDSVKILHFHSLEKEMLYAAAREEVDYEYHKGTCLSYIETYNYLKDSKKAYCWHISDLKIYDKPKELGEFYFPPERYCEKGLCVGCIHDAVPDVYGDYDYDCEWKRPIMRPPQSWCYVEELEK